MHPCRSHHCVHCLTLVILVLLPAIAAAKEAAVHRDRETLRLELPNDAVLTFALDGDRLLGLREATAEGLKLSSDATLLRPIIADDAWEQDRPWLVHALTLRDVQTAESGEVTLVLGLRAGRSEAAIKDLYLWAGDTARALGPAITPQLRDARDQAEAATKLLTAAAEKTSKVSALREQIEAKRRDVAEAKESGNRGLGRFRNELKKLEQQLAPVQASVFPDLAASEARYAEALKQIETFHKLRDERALEVGKIHRDYFGSAMFRLPAEANTPEAVRRLGRHDEGAFDAGVLRWVITPVEVNVAGWVYRGWKHHYQLQLADGLSTRFFRESGTWELGGDPVGTTVIAMRYRGLGGLDETFGRGTGGGVDRNFTTTETIPGAAGGAPLISPVVPPSEQRNDRGFGIAHRVSPWISRMVRGAGSAMFEFQHRPRGIFASFPEKLADLRAVTETFNGDEAISQINEELFPRGGKLTTTPMYYVALPAPKDGEFALHECRTRWQEMDQHTRDRVSEDIGFVQAEPLPGVGLNLDTAWEKRIATLTERMDAYGDLGMRMILVHQPGWMNGRGLRECKDPAFNKLAVGGGDCSIYDYVPRPTVGAEWKALTRKLAEHEVAYLVWSSYFSVGPGSFIQELRVEKGLGQEAFANFENPDAMDTEADFFTRLRIAHNPNHDIVRQAYVDRIENARDTYGHHGIWADSWHKWALVVGNDVKRPPSFRAWMQQCARWSRDGMAFVSEGQGSPIMNCSIELSGQKFEDEWWYLQYTTLWYRGKAEPPGSGTVEADRHTFRVMANKCWPFVETGWGQDVLEIIPDFKRLAHEYNRALPTMRRSIVLPDGGGVLWLGIDNDREGVWFPYADSKVPGGAKASYILDDSPAAKVEAYRTYRVSADDLYKAFKLRRGTENDPRLGKPQPRVEYDWPAWAK